MADHHAERAALVALVRHHNDIYEKATDLANIVSSTAYSIEHNRFPVEEVVHLEDYETIQALEALATRAMQNASRAEHVIDFLKRLDEQEEATNG